MKQQLQVFSLSYANPYLYSMGKLGPIKTGEVGRHAFARGGVLQRHEVRVYYQSFKKVHKSLKPRSHEFQVNGSPIK